MIHDGGGGFNPKKPKKPKTTMKSHFGYWVFLTKIKIPNVKNISSVRTR